MKEMFIGDTMDERIACISDFVLKGNAVEFNYFADSAGKILKKTVALFYLPSEIGKHKPGFYYGIWEIPGGGLRKIRNTVRLDDANHLKYRVKSELRFVPDRDITMISLHR
jgi:hypothetical protein